MSKVYQQHKSSFGFDANIVALMIYAIPFTIAIFIPQLAIVSIILPIVALIFEKDSGLVRFHACLSLLLSIVQYIVGIIFSVMFVGILFGAATSDVSLTNALTGGAITIVIAGLITLIFFVANLIAAFKAYRWTSVRFPLVGKLIANLVKED